MQQTQNTSEENIKEKGKQEARSFAHWNKFHFYRTDESCATVLEILIQCRSQ